MKTPKYLARVLTLAFLVPVLGAAASHRDRFGGITVMTRNMYVGADIFRIAAARTPEEVPVLAAQVLATVLESKPAERIDEMAVEIQRARPQLVGLQEAMLIRTQSPSDAIFGGTTPAESVLFDFVAMLEGSLRARGMDYRVAGVLENVDVEVPVLVGIVNGVPEFIDVRVTDRIAVLARSDVGTANLFMKHYEVTAMLPLAGQTLDYLRGFVTVDAWVDGRSYRFVNTHLEVDLPGPGLAIQAAQAQELLATVNTFEEPLIVVGDLNSGPENPPLVDGIASPYAQFLDAGFTDAWTFRHARRRGRGFTCCQDELLTNLPSSLDKRIDFVWLRNGDGIAPIRVRRVGAVPGGRTPSGRWPSDHAGVVARMHLFFD